MKSLINKLIESMTVKKAALLTALFLVMLWIIDFSPIGVAGLEKVTGGISILDFETRYTADFAYNWLSAMGEAGRNFHLTKVMPLDIFFPPCFMMLMFSWLSLLMQKTTKSCSSFRLLAVLPVVYMLLDWTENIGITAMLINFPARLDTIAVATGIVTSIKKTVILCVIITYLAQLIIMLKNKLTQSSSSSTASK